MSTAVKEEVFDSNFNHTFICTIWTLYMLSVYFKCVFQCEWTLIYLAVLNGLVILVTAKHIMHHQTNVLIATGVEHAYFKKQIYEALIQCNQAGPALKPMKPTQLHFAPVLGLSFITAWPQLQLWLLFVFTH